MLIADFAWATGIALTPVFREDGTAADACLFAICRLRRPRRDRLPVFERAETSDFLAAAPAILFAGVVSGAVGYTLQIVAQRYTPPAEAALILSMESVFAALAGALVLGERLTLMGAVGCGLILFGAVAAEVTPLARRNPGGVNSTI